MVVDEATLFVMRATPIPLVKVRYPLNLRVWKGEEPATDSLAEEEDTYPADEEV
jgi:hypothetical protein